MLQCCICYRLINSTDDTSDTLDDIIKKPAYSDEEVEEELNARLAKDLTFQKHKYKSKSKLYHRNNDPYDSDSDVDPERTINTNGDSSSEYKSNGFQTSLSKYAKEQFSKTFNGLTHSEYNRLDVAEQFVGELKDTQLQRISDTLDDMENTEVLQQSSNSNKMWLDKQLLESNGIGDSSTVVKKENCTKEEETKYPEDEPTYADILSGKVYHDTDNAHEETKDSSSSEEKRVEKSSQEAYEEKSTTNRSNGSNQPVHNSEKEYFRPKADETTSVMYRNDDETSNKNDVNVESQNKLNVSLENVDVLPNNVPMSQGAKSEATEIKQANDKKKISYNKEKLLATMKAIDDNENIEFLNQGFRNHNVNRMQMMENLHRGLPAHSKPKRDIIRDIFEDNHIESKVRGTCSKSH